MQKNKGKGGKNRKRGKNDADDEKRELIFKLRRRTRICASNTDYQDDKVDVILQYMPDEARLLKAY
ncbi:Eukaryotic translation initiation factor 1A [Populus alba x Populus x berolinensis]|uniref:Eukaryotic translation initiation factor 1A n=1 Tax=Populus alba x Populus x berolinensis TaxID=444605 RepID=A0AAD6PYJ2_9ROSI|nr:Eukaryotic translation initiation factor 1A [Populus alba x Populus x berolinensis]